MGILWLVDGVLYRDPAWQHSQAATEEALSGEASKTEQRNVQHAKNLDNTDPSAHRSSDTAETTLHEPKPLPKESTMLSAEGQNALIALPLPPPNSEVAAQPRAYLEHRIGTEALGVGPVSAIARAAGMQNEREDFEYSPSTVGHVMSRDVVTVTPSTSALEALEKLKDTGFHHLPVVGDEERLVGLVSDRDLLGRASNLGERMITEVLTASPNTGLQEAAQALVSKKFHSLVVIDDEQRPIGIVTSFDLLNFLVEHPAMKLWQRQAHTSMGA
jgi:CBS domain-containing protein